MRLHLYTRSYIKSDGRINLNPDLVHNIGDLLEKGNGKITWTLLISNIGNSNTIINKETLGINSFYFDIVYTSPMLSASEARYKILHQLYNEINRLFYLELPGENDILMNIDSDDNIINQDKLLNLVNSLTGYEFDLLAFGIKAIPNPNEFESWSFTESKLKLDRRYCTIDTQTMFLFMHSYKYVPEMTYRILRSRADPSESCEDTRMAINLAKINSGNKNNIRVSAVCSDFIEYRIHQDQVSKKQDLESKKEIGSELTEAGNLFVNHNFYKFEDNELIEYNPYNN